MLARTTCLLALAVAPSASILAQSAVVPAAYESVDARSLLNVQGVREPGRMQILIDGSELPVAMIGRELVSLTFRRDAATIRRALGGGSTQMTVHVSTAPHALAAQAREDMQANHGADVVRAFQGTVMVPASPAIPQGVAPPWTSSLDTLRIDFAPPYFRYVGGTLCLDVDGVPVAGDVSDDWVADAVVDTTRGTSTPIGETCQPPEDATRLAGGRTHVVVRDSLLLGNTMKADVRGLPGSIGFLMIGSRPAAVPVRLHMLGSPRCEILVDGFVASQPYVLESVFGPRSRHAGAYALATLHVPYVPSLAGTRLVSQWLLVGPRGGVTTSNAVDSTITGSNPPLGIATVRAPGDGTTTPTHGIVDRRLAHVVEIGYR